MACCLQGEEAWDLPRLVSKDHLDAFELLREYHDSRNFAATQTKGISSAIYQKFSSKSDAERAYMEALQAGYVAVL
jgi:hypothetical protein